jgi:hypothetical protein
MPVLGIVVTVLLILIGVLVTLSRQGKSSPRSPIQTPVRANPHPSNGRGFFYNQEIRNFVMYIVAASFLDHPSIAQRGVQHYFPSKRTTGRYTVLLDKIGHYRNCRQTRNVRAIVLCNHNLVFLALYCVVFPKYSAGQSNSYLYQINFGSPFFRFSSN